MIKRTRLILIIIGLLMLMTTSALATYFYAPQLFSYFSKPEIAQIPNVLIEVTPIPEPSITPEPAATAPTTVSVTKEKIATPSTQPKEKNTPKADSTSLAEVVKTYFKLLNQDNISIISQTATHAQGQIGQKWWLAVNARNGWKVVASGTSYINCNDIAGFNFPSAMAPACWDNATNQLINR